MYFGQYEQVNGREKGANPGLSGGGKLHPGHGPHDRCGQKHSDQAPGGCGPGLSGVSG